MIRDVGWTSDELLIITYRSPRTAPEGHESEPLQASEHRRNGLMDQMKQLSAWLQQAGPSRSDIPTTDRAWDDLAGSACRSGLAGLLLEAAARLEARLPVQVMERLRRRARATAAENLSAMHVLDGVVQAFHRAHVPVMLLKGAALIRTVYPRYDLRPMSDVDLLVRPGSAGQALRLLERHGCCRGLDLLREDFFPKYHYEVDFITDSPRPLRIDLHARPLRPLRVARTMPDDALWEGAFVVRIEEAEVLVPSPELMFIHLAAHAAYHGCSRLLWLYDLARLVDVCAAGAKAPGSQRDDSFNDAMDWSLVARRAGEWGLSLPVTRAIERASALMGPICPPHVLDALRAHRVSWRDRLVLDRAPGDAASPVAHVAVNLLCTPGMWFRLGYLLALLRPGRKHLGEVYPFRHPAWPVCAHIWRVVRAMGRIVGELRITNYENTRRWTPRTRGHRAPRISPTGCHEQGSGGVTAKARPWRGRVTERAFGRGLSVPPTLRNL